MPGVRELPPLSVRSPPSIICTVLPGILSPMTRVFATARDVPSGGLPICTVVPLSTTARCSLVGGRFGVQFSGTNQLLVPSGPCQNLLSCAYKDDCTPKNTLKAVSHRLPQREPPDERSRRRVKAPSGIHA